MSKTTRLPASLVCKRSGGPSAWTAALRFVPEVFLLEVGAGKRQRV